SARHGLCESCHAQAQSGTTATPRRHAPAVSPSEGPASNRPGLRKWLVVGTLAVAVVVGVIVFAGRMMQSGPDFGEAGSVLRFADRSYEGASWRVVRKATSLGDLSKLGSRRRVVELSRIYGFDDDNLWLVDAKGAVFRLERGHWKLAANLPDLARHPHGRVLDRDTLLVGGQYGRPAHKIHRIGADGIRSFELQNEKAARDRSRPVERGDAIIPFAPGITYLATGSHYTGTSHKLMGDELKVLHPDKGHPESVIVDSDGAPIQLESGRVPMPKLQDLWLAEVFAEGEVLAVARFVNGSRDLHPPMLVRYRSGTWVCSEEIALENTGLYRTGWLSQTNDKRAFCVFVGKGQALIYQEGRGVTSHPINAATSATIPDLIDVWGVSPDHFWVMDRTGSVWERSENRWRQVVRGMLEDDVIFNHSWVSPDGTVYTITSDTLYKLD
ncbi:MAG TPA: hypothetical protein VLO11_05715, partial [Luteolibacter sp.]|nr:hypothetical protein [Luteolibacter sp.]